MGYEREPLLPQLAELARLSTPAVYLVKSCAVDIAAPSPCSHFLSREEVI